MKQVHANYTFNASTKTITLIGLNIAQDKLLLITNATRGVIYYNFASSSHRAVVTAGANTTVVLTDASTTGHADSDQLVIHYDDQLSTQTIAGTVTANVFSDSFTNLEGVIAGNDGSGQEPYLGVQLGFYDPVSQAYNTVKQSNPLPISGTVTANVPNADTFIKPNGTGGFGDTLEPDDDNLAEMCVAVHIKDVFGNILGANKDFPATANLPALNWNTVKIAYGGNTVWNGIYKKGPNGYVNAEGGGTPEYIPVDGFFYGATFPKLTRGTHPGGPLSFTGTRWYFEANGDVQFYSTTTATDLRVIANWTDSGGDADVQITPYSVEPVAIPGGVEIAFSSLGQAPSVVTNSNPFPVKVQNSVTIGSLPAISGTVTANVFGQDENNVAQPLPLIETDGIENVERELAVSSIIVDNNGNSIFNNVQGPLGLPIAARRLGLSQIIDYITAENNRLDTNVKNSVTIGSLPAISGTVTAASDKGSVSEASTQSITTGGTHQKVFDVNANRKYLLIQNISDTDMYLGLGFNPSNTTPAGLLLAKSGGGIVFESSYIPTSEVRIVCATTGKRFVALQG